MARLKVRNPSGDVRVQAGEASETTVELIALDDSEATRRAIETARVEGRGDDVLVEIEGRGWSISIGDWGIGRNPRVGVRLTCPTGSDLECETASADIATTGALGTVRLRTASGDAELDVVQGELFAKGASGDIRVARVGGDAELKTVSGDADVRSALGSLTVNSVSGDVEVGEVAGKLTITSVSGDHRVAAAGPGDIVLKAVSGDIDVSVRTGLRLRLDVNSVSGTIRSDLEVRDAPSSGEAQEVDLRARTVSGDVRIGRTQSSADSASARIAIA